MSFLGGSAGKDSAGNMEDLGSIPELRISPGEGNGYPLQYSGLENFVDHGVHRESDTVEQLSITHCLNACVHFDPSFHNALLHT